MSGKLKATIIVLVAVALVAFVSWKILTVDGDSKPLPGKSDSPSTKQTDTQDKKAKDIDSTDNASNLTKPPDSGTYSITGRVLAAIDNTPINNAQVSYEYYKKWKPGVDPIHKKTSSGKNGDFGIYLPTTTYGSWNWVQVEAESYAAHSTSIWWDRKKKKPKDIGDIHLSKGIQIQIKVTDASNGQPISGSTIRFYRLQGKQKGNNEPARFSIQLKKRTNETGAASICLEDGTYKVITRADGYLTDRKEDILIEESNTSLIVKLVKGAELSGTVVDEEGCAIKDASVSAGVEYKTQWGMETTIYDREETNGDGIFLLNGLPHGNSFTISADADEFLSTSVENVSLDCKSLTLTLKKAATISGIVIHENGSIIPKAKLILEHKNENDEFESYYGSVDGPDKENGQFKVNKLVPGSNYRISAKAKNLISCIAVVVAGGNETITIVLSEGEIISGHVVDEVGEPVTEASVSAFEESSGGEVSETTADNEGAFRLTGFGAEGEYSIRAEKTGYKKRLWNVSRFPPGSTDIIIVLPHNLLMNGVITDADTGKPIPGVRVGVEDIKSGWGWSGVASDNSGNYSIQLDADIKKYSVKIRSKTHNDIDEHILEIPHETKGVYIKNYQLERGIIVSGTITDAATRKPLEGVKICTDDFGFGKETHSDAQGKYLLGGIGVGVVDLKFRLIKYVSEHREVNATAEGIQLDVTMAAGGTIEGKVTDSQGSNLDRIHVSAVNLDTGNLSDKSRKDAWATWTGRNGYKFAGVNAGSKYSVVAGGEGYLMQEKQILVQKGETVKVDFELSPVPAIHGRVTNEQGEPIKGAEVEFTEYWKNRHGASEIAERYESERDSGSGYNRFVHHQNSRNGTSTPRFTTEKDGKFKIDNASPGCWMVKVKAEGYIENETGPIIYTHEHGCENLSIILEKGRAISGTVMDTDGNPISKVAVSVTADLYHRAGEAETDEKGNYTIAGIRSGELEIDATLKGYYGGYIRTVEPGQDKVDFTLNKCGVIRGRIVGVDEYKQVNVRAEPNEALPSITYPFDADNKTLREFRTKNGERDERSASDYFHYPKNEFEIFVPAGIYKITATGSGFLGTEVKDIVVEDGQATEGVTIEVAKGASIKVTVLRKEDRVPLQHATINLIPEDKHDKSRASGKNNTHGWTERDGSVTIAGVIPGKYYVRAKGSSFSGNTIGPVDIGLEKKTEVEILLGEAGMIIGKVLDHTGQPKKEVIVTLIFRDSHEQTNRHIDNKETDKNGMFSFSGLTAGKYTLQAELDKKAGFAALFSVGDGKIEVEVAEGEIVTCTIKFGKKTRVYGLVYKGENPVTEYELTFLPDGSPFGGIEVEVGSGGNYEIEVLPGKYTAIISIEGIGATRIDIIVPEQDGFQQDFEFSTASISGIVMSPDGTPIDNAGVLLLEAKDVVDINSFGMSDFFKILTGNCNTDSKGCFKFENIAPGEWVIVAFKDSYASGQSSTILIGKDAVEENIRIRLKEAAKLSGHIVDSQGNPVTGVSLIAIEADTTGSRNLFDLLSGADTDNNGDFTFEQIVPGEHVIYGTKVGYGQIAKRITVAESGVSIQNFVISKGGNIKITVTSNLEPLEGTKIEVTNSDGVKMLTGGLMASNSIGTSNSAGIILVKDLPPGQYSGKITKSGYSEHVQSFTVTAGQTVEIAVELHRQ
ncbi:MAG: carboxypeptidase regulatory-like domain-containing protein [Planctomycetota bacterium]|jgi:protocatechuate 3,4-dioxygenase beta subunit